MIHIFKILFIGLLGFTSLHAKMIFDLQEQYFEHAYNQSSKSGLYKLPNVSVSTINILQQKDGKYVTDFASSGMLIVRLNEIKENFSMSMKARYKSTYFIIAALVAFSRVYVGVHYPADIIFGGLLGFGLAWAVLSLWVIIKMRELKRGADWVVY